LLILHIHVLFANNALLSGVGIGGYKKIKGITKPLMAITLLIGLLCN